MLHFSIKNKNPFVPFGRMGSSLDNRGRYISLSSEDLSGDPLQRQIPRLLGYPLMDYISQDRSIVVLLGLIVKSNKGRCLRIEVSLTVRFFLLF